MGPNTSGPFSFAADANSGANTSFRLRGGPGMARLEEGQVAVITGAAAGIGFALAEAFLGKGLRVVITDRDAQALDQAAAQLRANGRAVGRDRCRCGVRFAHHRGEGLRRRRRPVQQRRRIQRLEAHLEHRPGWLEEAVRREILGRGVRNPGLSCAGLSSAAGATCSIRRRWVAFRLCPAPEPAVRPSTPSWPCPKRCGGTWMRRDTPPSA